MVAAATRLSDSAAIARIRKSLPIYIVAGDADPVNHNLEWLKPLAERYGAAGIVSVAEKYYSQGRHEMLNETNRDEVVSDIAKLDAKSDFQVVISRRSPIWQTRPQRPPILRPSNRDSATSGMRMFATSS